MKHLSVLLLISYIGLAVFGVFDISHGQTHDMNPNNCIAATMKGVDCPKEADPIDFATFHIDAFQSFSLATFGDSITGILLLAFSILLAFGLAFFPSQFFPAPRIAFYKHRFRDSFSSPQQQELTRWLALHENSPAFS